MKQHRMLIIDSYYPDAIEALPVDPTSTYDKELRKVLDASFGTADFYSRNLRNLGWEVDDFVANHTALNALRPEHNFPIPDVLFLQDLSWSLQDWINPKILAGQCSCPWPGDENIRKCDVIFSSFPHYIPRIEALGVKAVYNPLAFDPIVLERIERPGSRKFDCVFVGGIGIPSHWYYGMKVLGAIASAIPTFQWWGYGVEDLPANDALRPKYQGEAWGLDMYKIFSQAKIVVNRHGEVAGSFANNMRLFEATGTGALLLTEAKDNLHDLFAPDEVATYRSSQEAVNQIQYYLAHEQERQSIANKGRARTLADHTYAKRMKTISDTLRAML